MLFFSDSFQDSTAEEKLFLPILLSCRTPGYDGLLSLGHGLPLPYILPRANSPPPVLGLLLALQPLSPFLGTRFEQTEPPVHLFPQSFVFQSSSSFVLLPNGGELDPDFPFSCTAFFFLLVLEIWLVSCLEDRVSRLTVSFSQSLPSLILNA